MVTDTGQNTPSTNAQIAQSLREVAARLELRTDSPFRIAAYRAAASTIARLDRPVSAIVSERGIAGLCELPGIGDSLARSIKQLVDDGHLDLLEELRRQSRRDADVSTLPGVGKKLAGRIGELLAAETIDELQAAAQDGRLREVPGIGRKRARAIRESLVARLGRARGKSSSARPGRSGNQPPVSELLSVDSEYRELAARHALPRVAPSQFNPTGAAWLPVLRTTRGPRKYTAFYSNSARAHQSHGLGDWVVIYGGDARGEPWTIITSRYGRLRGRRVVRGREAECRVYYDALPQQQMLDFSP
jgi:DNA polymerase (family 10)